MVGTGDLQLGRGPLAIRDFMDDQRHTKPHSTPSVEAGQLHNVTLRCAARPLAPANQVLLLMLPKHGFLASRHSLSFVATGAKSSAFFVHLARPEPESLKI